MGKTKFSWIGDVNLGANYFDEDHSALLEKFNSLIEALQVRDHALILSAIGALSEVASDHFSHEEQRMRKSGYPACDKHGLSHKKLLQSLSELSKKISRREVDTDFDVLAESSFLEHWLIPHLTNDDQQFSEFLSAQEYIKNVQPPY
jgi:hemerythrin-like metal-binding protein